MDLQRFIVAQRSDYEKALEEIKRGRKESHWMWYIFPQIKGLGFSSMSIYYSIPSLEDAKEYYSNEYLRNNLKEITNAVLSLEGKSISEIMGYPDDMKLRSSMTLFYLATSNQIFMDVISKYFNGKLDENTIDILKNNN